MKSPSRSFLLFTAVFILFAASLSFAQPKGYVEIPSRDLRRERGIDCYQLKAGVYDRARLDAVAAVENCKKDLPLDKIDPERETLVRYSVASDCHMRVVVKVFRVDAEKKYKVITNIIYGGCRAGGWRSGWVTFEKMPSGYTVDLEDVMVDRIHGSPEIEGTGDEKFQFPLPPAVVEKQSISVTEIDLNGCLPLQGQSRWLINSNSVLERAIAADADVERCREVIEQKNIDLSTTSLIGYSFASGHCERPLGLSFEGVKETSSRQRENRYLITATYDNAGSESCKVWKTYGVWLLVPKLASGFGFEMRAAAR